MCRRNAATLAIDKPWIEWLQVNKDSVEASFTVECKQNEDRHYLLVNSDGPLVNFISNDRYAQMDNGTMATYVEHALKIYRNKWLQGHPYAEAVYTYPMEVLCTAHLT